MRRKRKFKVQSAELDMERVILQFMCVGSLAGVTYLRYTVLTSPNKGETSVHCCDPALLVPCHVGALTIAMEFSVIPGGIQMERFNPVERFRKKGNTFRGISFFSLLPEFP